MNSLPKCVVLFSGGLDSTVCLSLALEEYGPENVCTLSFRYGQRHQDVELAQAEFILDALQVPLSNRLIQNISYAKAASNNALMTGAVEDGNLKRAYGLPAPTYVPGRNLLFVAYGNALAEGLGASSIYIGVNQVDCSGYPDCRDAFLLPLKQAIAALGMNVELRAPLLTLSKAEIAALGQKLGSPLHLTHSCYRGTRPACGTCDACLLRIEGFRLAGLKDPIDYAIPIQWGCR